MTDCLISDAEAAVLFGLIRGLQPIDVLEIGSYKGGSAAIIAKAMHENEFGRLFCVDPEPLFDPEEPRFRGRVTVIKGISPDIINEAATRCLHDGGFEFVFIDGNHSKQSVVWDFEAVLPHVAWNGYVLFHDAHYPGVREAIDHLRTTYADRIVDCGLISTGSTQDENGTWGGLYLLRVVC
jgi:predicted O-methyltransferase YrrM